MGDRRLTALRRIVTRRTGWALAVVLTVLGILLGAQQLARAADLAGQALGDATRTALDAGWLLLLLAAAALAAGLALSSPQGRATARWLRRWLTARPVLLVAAATGLLVILMLVLVVVVAPPRFTTNRDFKTDSEELTAQSAVRTTLLQGFAALLLLTGAGVGAAATLRQVRATREGQITDRYTKAVDQLGSDHLDVRLGGIYALERIARDSPSDRATIEEVLTAYVRGHAPWPPAPSPSPPAITRRLTSLVQRQRSALRRRTAGDTAGRALPGRADVQAALPEDPAADVQAAAAVLGRRKPPPGRRRRLDLTRGDLRRALLYRANLQDARLTDTNLQEAWLADANLQGAWLTRANLQDATLTQANLRGAQLINANLQDANLDGADLQDARLTEANLQGAQLINANLQDANLDGADLRDANLRDARADEGTRWPPDWNRAKAEAHGVRYRD